MLVSPNRFDRLALTVFLRIPVEELVFVGLAPTLPPLARPILVAMLGSLSAFFQ